MTRRNRILLGALLGPSLMLCCLAAGTWIGGRFYVPPGSGLAGPAMALGYGVLSAAGGGLAAVLLAIYLPGHWLWRLTLSTAVAATGLAVVIARLYVAAQAQLQDQLEQAEGKPRHEGHP